MRDGLEILPVSGIGRITEGDDLADVIARAAPWLRDGDVLVVTSKIVAKAEGRVVEVPSDPAQRDAARQALVTAEAARVVARRGSTRIVVTHHGFVMAGAGIDNSNVETSALVLLPKDPDASARLLRSRLRERLGLDVAVVVSDTMGRPWRLGLTDVALGVAGLDPILDHRGETDPYGNELYLTQMAVADELAGAAELVKGKCDQVPVAVVRGFATPGAAPRPDGPGAAAMIRDAADDLFSLGTAEARSAGLNDAAALADAMTLPGGGADPAATRSVVAEALATTPVATTTRLRLLEPAGDESVSGLGLPAHTVAVIACGADPAGPAPMVALGADIHRLRCALAARTLASHLIALPDGTCRLAIGASPGTA